MRRRSFLRLWCTRLGTNVYYILGTWVLTVRSVNSIIMKSLVILGSDCQYHTEISSSSPRLQSLGWCDAVHRASLSYHLISKTLCNCSCITILFHHNMSADVLSLISIFWFYDLPIGTSPSLFGHTSVTYYDALLLCTLLLEFLKNFLYLYSTKNYFVETFLFSLQSTLCESSTNVFL